MTRGLQINWTKLFNLREQKLSCCAKAVRFLVHGCRIGINPVKVPVFCCSGEVVRYHFASIIKAQQLLAVGSWHFHEFFWAICFRRLMSLTLFSNFWYIFSLLLRFSGFWVELVHSLNLFSKHKRHFSLRLVFCILVTFYDWHMFELRQHRSFASCLLLFNAFPGEHLFSTILERTLLTDWRQNCHMCSPLDYLSN